MFGCCREEAQKCYCGSDNCRGILGGPPPKDSRRAGTVHMQMELLAGVWLPSVCTCVQASLVCAGRGGGEKE